MSLAPLSLRASFAATALATTLTMGAATLATAQDIPVGHRVNSIATGRDPNVGNYNATTNYMLRCAGCHGVSGMGTTNAGVPPFPDSVGHIAALDEGRTYMLHVPGVISSSLSNEQIAGVLNYIVDRWSDEPVEHFTTEEVERRRAADVPDIVAARRVVVDTLLAQGISVAEYPWP